MSSCVDIAGVGQSMRVCPGDSLQGVVGSALLIWRPPDDLSNLHSCMSI